MRNEPSANIALLEVSEAHADPFRMDEVTRQLQRELTERRLTAERRGVPSPSGAKSGMAATIGALAVAVSTSPLITRLVDGVFAWLTAARAARSERTIKVTRGERSIELSDPTPEQRQQLIEWLMRNTDAPDAPS